MTNVVDMGDELRRRGGDAHLARRRRAERRARLLLRLFNIDIDSADVGEMLALCDAVNAEFERDREPL